MKKKFSVIGMAVGMLLAFLGILTVSGVFGNGNYSAGVSPYDSGYAKFGGDYYTYSVNNSAETASAAKAAANNLREISDILKNGIGFSMMAMGLFAFCGFGIVFSGCVKKPEEISSENAEKTEEIKLLESLDKDFSKTDIFEEENPPEAPDEPIFVPNEENV